MNYGPNVRALIAWKLDQHGSFRDPIVPGLARTQAAVVAIEHVEKAMRIARAEWIAAYGPEAEQPGDEMLAARLLERVSPVEAS